MSDNRSEFELFFSLEETNAYEQLKSGNIYVENIRSRMDVPYRIAKEKCDEAVTKGILMHKIGLICPNDNRILASYDNPQQIPATLTCDICEAEEKTHEFDTEYLKRINFYLLP